MKRQTDKTYKIKEEYQTITVISLQRHRIRIIIYVCISDTINTSSHMNYEYKFKEIRGMMQMLMTVE